MKHLKEAKYTYLKGRITHYKKLALVFLPLGLIGLILLPVLSAFSAVLWIPTLYFLGRCSPWRRGLKGEMRVSESLGELDDSYCSLDDVVLNLKTGNIDHIVIGPTGIFVLETKNYRGELACEGDDWYVKFRRRRRYLPSKKPVKSFSIQIKRNAGVVRDFLRAEGIAKDVESILVFADDGVKLRLRKPTVNVKVLADLRTYIEERSASLSPEEVDKIGRVLLGAASRF